MTQAGRIAAMVALALLGGCGTVAPWERGNLARPQMESEPHPAQRTLLEHIYRSREATSSSGSAEGGGCGCY